MTRLGKASECVAYSWWGRTKKIHSAQAAVRRLNRVAPQVKTESIPGAGHELTIVQADFVVGKVLEFLGERAEAGAATA
jgi:pimeloyl-ACP methyl ester carboxylesterase